MILEKASLFELEKRGRFQAGNSLVIHIPKEIIDSLGIKRDLPVLIYPSERRKLVVEVEKK